MPLPSQGPINILITGAAGLVGLLLAARLLSDPQAQYNLLITDLAEPAIPAHHPQHAHPNVTAVQGDITSPAFVTSLLAHPAVQPLHAVFLFHGIMSAASERDYDASLRVNVDSVRLVVEALRRAHPGARLVYASSLAVFGPPWPREYDQDQGNAGSIEGLGKGKKGKIPAGWAPTPQSTYGAHKLLTEAYLNEVHRRGWLDVFTCRFPTISVRPGKPTGAASSFLSGIVREPLNGVECVVPLRDRSFRAFLASPRVVAENLVRVLLMESGALPSHVRQILFPGIAVSVQELMDAVAKYGGEEALRLIKEEPDEGLEKILRSWAEDYDISTPLRLGLEVDKSADDLVREYAKELKKSV